MNHISKLLIYPELTLQGKPTKVTLKLQMISTVKSFLADSCQGPKLPFWDRVVCSII